MEGIRFIKQNEAYSSQVSPLKNDVSRSNAVKSNRKTRGLYKDGNNSWNADCVGAFNILRLYLSSIQSKIVLNQSNIKEPYIAKVAA